MESTTIEVNQTHVYEDLGVTDSATAASDVDSISKFLITSGPVFDLFEKAALEIYIYPLVILLVFIFVGLIGNTFVLYIFSTKWERNKTSVFIITLAVLDIANCSVIMPYEVAVLAKPFSFDHDLLCKALRCLSYIVTASYSFVLVAVAFDRYLMICKPLKRMTLGTGYATKTCIGAVVIAVVSQFPSFFLYGTFTFTYPVNIPSSNETVRNTTANTPLILVEGRTCLVTNYFYYVNRTPTLLFQGFLFIGHVIIFLTLTVVYILIGRRLYISSHTDIVDSGSQQGLLKRSIMSAITGTSGSISKQANDQSDDESQGKMPKKNNKMKSRIEQIRGSGELSWKRDNAAFEQTSPSKFRSLHSIPSCHESEAKALHIRRDSDKLPPNFILHPVNGSRENQQHLYGATSGASKSPQKPMNRSVSLDIGRLSSIANPQSLKPNTDLKEMSLRRNTLIMRMVTFTFMLSYLPFLILVTLRYSNPDVPTKLGKREKIVYHVFLRTYFLNSVIRPFIYIVMNARYRSKILSMVNCFRR